MIFLIKRIISCQLFYKERKHIHYKLHLCLLQPLIIFILNTPKFLIHQFIPRYFHVYILKLIDGICLDLVSCSCFQTIQKLSDHAPSNLRFSNLYRKQKRLCQLQNYRHQWIRPDKINNVSKC